MDFRASNIKKLPHHDKSHGLRQLILNGAFWAKLAKICLTHWGRVTHICVSDLTSIGSDNGLSPGRCQAIIRTNAGILLIRPLGTNFSEFLVEILKFSFKKMRLKVSSAKWRPFCLGLNVLNECIAYAGALAGDPVITSEKHITSQWHIRCRTAVLKIGTICHVRDLLKWIRSCIHLRLLCPPDLLNLPRTALLISKLPGSKQSGRSSKVVALFFCY